MSDDVTSFLSFLEKAPTPFHCVSELAALFAANGFLPLSEKRVWKAEPGKKYFVSRGGSFACFSLPKEAPTKIVLLAAHTDSPGLKLKPSPLIQKKGASVLGVEPYGSPILHSWLNEDLAIAGRVFYKDRQGCLRHRLLFLRDTPLIIPELPIHLQRDVNEKGPLVNPQDHLTPLFGGADRPELSFSSFIEEHLEGGSLLSHDLFLVPTRKPALLGPERDPIASYRLDNLTSVYAAATAMTRASESPALTLSIFWDHEETGSLSAEGARSSFLEEILLRIRLLYSIGEEEFSVLKQHSLCLSLDTAHALNPIHEAKYDPCHTPLLGRGFVLKQNGSNRYASSGETIAEAILLAERAKIPLQHFSCRSDALSGTTVGPYVAARTGIPCVDAGCPQLSMHSIREIVSTKDYLDSIAFLLEALRGR